MKWKFFLGGTAVAVGLVLTAGLAYGALVNRQFDLPITATVTVKSAFAAADVNDDGRVDEVDLKLVARNLGISPPADIGADVDGNLVVDVYDLAFVARYLSLQL